MKSWRQSDTNQVSVINEADTLSRDSLSIDSISKKVIPLPIRAETGDLVVNMDSTITLLYLESKSETKAVNGFRVQIYFGDLESAREIRAKCRKTLGDLGVYLISISPNYSVSVGNFRDRWEAELVLKELKKTYRQALIVPAEIELPELK
tara:strand:- start:5738 stop:6187 length:450 start_codon:yes stop_codon:yes gene_type:complete